MLKLCGSYENRPSKVTFSSDTGIYITIMLLSKTNFKQLPMMSTSFSCKADPTYILVFGQQLSC